MRRYGDVSFDTLCSVSSTIHTPTIYEDGLLLLMAHQARRSISGGRVDKRTGQGGMERWRKSL